MIKGRLMKFSLIFKGAFIDLCALGILLNFLSLDQPFYRTMSYYTIQSNIACLIFMIVMFVKEWRGMIPSQKLIRLKGGFTVMIFLTFVIYHFLLRPVIVEYETDYQVFQLSDILVHYVAPIMMLLDFIFFTERRQFKKIDPIWWLVIPLTYWVYTILYAAFGGVFTIGEEVSHYPYFFLNFDAWGFFGVMLWVLAIMVLYLLLGYGLLGIGHLIDRYQFKKTSNLTSD